MARRAIGSDGTKVERRKKQRFAVAVPIEVSWRGPDGILVTENATARQVNLSGGLLQMVNYPEVGSRVTLTNLISAETIEARVLATPSCREGVSEGIIVELTVPNEAFWGVAFQLKKTAIELQKLDESLRSGGIDEHLLKEFRMAAEHVRSVAKAAQQLSERQVHSQYDVPSVLLTERIR
jgi:hypothetical protein